MKIMLNFTDIYKAMRLYNALKNHEWEDGVIGLCEDAVIKDIRNLPIEAQLSDEDYEMIADTAIRAMLHKLGLRRLLNKGK